MSRARRYASLSRQPFKPTAPLPGNQRPFGQNLHEAPHSLLVLEVLASAFKGWSSSMGLYHANSSKNSVNFCGNKCIHRFIAQKRQNLTTIRSGFDGKILFHSVSTGIRLWQIEEEACRSAKDSLTQSRNPRWKSKNIVQLRKRHSKRSPGLCSRSVRAVLSIRLCRIAKSGLSGRFSWGNREAEQTPPILLPIPFLAR